MKAINFIRLTKLKRTSGGAVGRIDYITDKNRQENIITTGHSEPEFDFKTYQQWEEEMSADGICGRELIISLPQDWKNKPDGVLNSNVENLAKRFLGSDTPFEYAVHFVSPDNLHAHIVFCERKYQRQVDAFEVYKRDVWIDECGKLAKSKKDRHTLIHRKGDLKYDDLGRKIPKEIELKDMYSNKNRVFASKSWLHYIKKDYKSFLEREGYSIIDNAISEIHEGKGMSRANIADIKATNENIRKINSSYTEFFNSPGELKAYMEQIKKQMNAPYTKSVAVTQTVINNFNRGLFKNRDHTNNIPDSSMTPKTVLNDFDPKKYINTHENDLSALKDVSEPKKDTKTNSFIAQMQNYQKEVENREKENKTKYKHSKRERDI